MARLYQRLTALRAHGDPTGHNGSNDRLRHRPSSPILPGPLRIAVGEPAISHPATLFIPGVNCSRREYVVTTEAIQCLRRLMLEVPHSSVLDPCAVRLVVAICSRQKPVGQFYDTTRDAPYFRLVRLEHGSHNGTIVASEGIEGNGITGDIWQSIDNGNSWTQVATVPVIAGSTLWVGVRYLRCLRLLAFWLLARCSTRIPILWGRKRPSRSTSVPTQVAPGAI